MSEIWVPCLGHEKYIEVSNQARVRTIERTSSHIRDGKVITAKFKSKILSKCIANHGYHEIAYKANNKRIKLRVHRLVAIAFVQGYSPELTVNHIDGNKLNNSIENLEWVTLSKNTLLQWETGLVDIRGDKHPNKKLSSGKVRILRELLKLGATPNSLAVLMELSPKLLYLIRDNKRWSDIYIPNN